MRKDNLLPKRLIRFCGSNCSKCKKYKQFLAGDESGLVNPENDYRCCWLPTDYPKGRDCPIRMCCEEKGFVFCGECDQLEACVRMQEFYAQPGYDELKKRRLVETAKRKLNRDKEG